MACKQITADPVDIQDFTPFIDQLEGDENDTIKCILTKMNNAMIQLQKSNCFILQENDDLKNNCTDLTKRLELTESLVTVLRKQNQQQGNEILDLQARSMRDNLIFTGIEEKDRENTLEVLRNFLATEMKVPQTQSITFDRVHRMGPPGQTNRSIIAKLNHSSDKGKILACGKNLKDKNFRVFEQFPPAVQEKRKRLMPLFKSAKSDPLKKVSWSVDKRSHSHS
jgi:hypothetical protein